jgi:DNA-binding MarR family transcriptional regulator
MPRKRRNNLTPKKSITASTGPLVDHELSNGAYRLYHLIIALSGQAGHVDAYNGELGGHLGVSKETVRRLLLELTGRGLVTETRQPDGRHRLTPVTDQIQPQRRNGHNGTSAQCSEPAQLWQHYFGQNKRACEAIDRYLVDEAVRQAAAAAGETPGDWLKGAIDKTAAYEPKHPLPYLKRVIKTQLAEAESVAVEPLQFSQQLPPEPQPDEPIDELTAIWSETTDTLARQMAKQTFDANLLDSRLISAEDGLYVIEAQTALAAEWLAGRLRAVVKRALEGVVGESVDIEFIAGGQQ